MDNTLNKLTVDYNSDTFSKDLCEIYQKYGVAIIENVFTKEYCDEIMDYLVFLFESLNTGVDRNDIKTWIKENLPPQTRPGLYQNLMGHTIPVWKMRTDPNVKNIFQILYSYLRGKKVTKFITSLDGINVLPNGSGNYHKENNDWPHIDQTYGDKFKCIQGQAVLTNTTAAFRSTPGSCHHYSKVLELAGVSKKDKSNWNLFKKTEKKIREYLEEVEQGLEWQIPIYTKAGSFIVWSSSTIHSAKLPDKKEEKDNNDIWKGWRGVIYVCLRPRDEISDHVIEKRKKHFNTNRLTPHWGETVVAKRPGGRYLYGKGQERDSMIEYCLDHPEHIYDLLGKPEESEVSDLL